MSEVMEWMISAGILFLLAVVMFFYGIHARSKKYFYMSFLFLFLGMVVGAWTGYLFISKSYHKLKEGEKEKLIVNQDAEIAYKNFEDHRVIFGTVTV